MQSKTPLVDYDSIIRSQSIEPKFINAINIISLSNNTSIISIMIRIIVVLFAALCLVTSAPAEDKMKVIPVKYMAFRVILSIIIPAFTQAISVSNHQIEKPTTSSLNPSMALTTKILSHCGSTEGQDALPS